MTAARESDRDDRFAPQRCGADTFFLRRRVLTEAG
jgi:hypothetical protein